MKSFCAQRTALLCSDREICSIAPPASFTKSDNSEIWAWNAFASAVRNPLLASLQLSRTSSAGSISRRFRSLAMVQNIFQTSFSASKNSFRSPLRITLLINPQPISSRKLLWALPADFQFFHHLISAQRIGADHQQRMDLCHRSIDSPGTSHRSPLHHKLVSDFIKCWIRLTCWSVFIHCFQYLLKIRFLQVESTPFGAIFLFSGGNRQKTCPPANRRL